MKITLDQMFLNREGEVEFETDGDLDNNEAMQEFLKHNHLEKNILVDDGTMVFLISHKHDDVLVLESRGKGDGFIKIVDYYIQTVEQLKLSKEDFQRIKEIKGQV